MRLLLCIGAILVDIRPLCAQTIRLGPKPGEPKVATIEPGSAASFPHNYYGVHLLVGSGSGKDLRQLKWARHLVGRWGYAKTLHMNIDADTSGPDKNWIDYVQACYQLELIPVLRLGGRMRNGQWIKPQADRPGDYTSLARSIRRIVNGLPLSPKCPLYIELWNEPNIPSEWSGQADPGEYAAFFVQAAKAIHAIGDPRIQVLNGGLATDPDYAEKLCKADPEFVKSFDLWACHPYPGNRPPAVNLHQRTAPPNSLLAIDAYLLELDVLKRYDPRSVQVVITETGHDLGSSTFTRDGYAIIDEYNRADYMVRAFRDYYPKWPEVKAVFPFEFCGENWERFDWVYPDSGTDPEGAPTHAHYQYTAVAALAKPTDETGAINGTIKAEGLDARLDDVSVSILGQKVVSDPMGNYFLPKLKPGVYHVEFERQGFNSYTHNAHVTAGANAVIDVGLTATRKETLSGMVRDGDNEQPLNHVKITLQPGGLKTQTNSDGRFSIAGIVPARYRLIAEASGRCPYETNDIEVKAGRTNTWDFRLGRLAPHLSNDNLINNPSIEAGGGGAGKQALALGFEPGNDLGKSESNFDLSDRHAHTGRHAQEIRFRSEEVIVRQITHYNTANPGERYIAGAWILSDTGDSGNVAWVTLDFTDNGGTLIRRIEPREPVKGRSRGWVWISAESIAPPGAQRLAISLHTKGKSSSVCFDDAFLGQVPRR